MAGSSQSQQLAEAAKNFDEDQMKTAREFSKIYNTMSELCFTQCVWDFGTDQIRNREMRCAMDCTENYLQMTKLIGTEFAKGHASNVVAASQMS